MNYSYITLDSQENLIQGVVLKKLIVHSDDSGSLVETLRTDWDDVFGKDFTMQYVSQTPSGLIRDKDKWHVHKYQKDRFACIAGRIITAIYDPRVDSKTKGNLNLFVMGPEKEKEMYMVVIPEGAYHGFMVVSKEAGYLINFPTKLYNPDDEGRIENKELDWEKIRQDFPIDE